MAQQPDVRWGRTGGASGSFFRGRHDGDGANANKQVVQKILSFLDQEHFSQKNDFFGETKKKLGGLGVNTRKISRMIRENIHLTPLLTCRCVCVLNVSLFQVEKVKSDLV